MTRRMLSLFVAFVSVSTVGAANTSFAADTSDPVFAAHLRHAAGEYQGFQGRLSATGGSAGELDLSCEKIRIYAHSLDQPSGAANISVCTFDNRCVDVGIGYTGDSQSLQRLTKTEMLYDYADVTSYFGDYLASYLVGGAPFNEGPRRLLERKRSRVYLRFSEADGTLQAVQLGYSFRRRVNFLESKELIHNEVNCVRPRLNN